MACDHNLGSLRLGCPQVCGFLRAASAGAQNLPSLHKRVSFSPMSLSGLKRGTCRVAAGLTSRNHQERKTLLVLHKLASEASRGSIARLCFSEDTSGVMMLRSLGKYTQCCVARNLGKIHVSSPKHFIRMPRPRLVRLNQT